MRSLPPILTRADLDRGQCESPGCDHSSHGPLALSGRCHPRAAVEVWYDAAEGTLTLRCHRCQLAVSRVAVAAGTPVVN